MKETTISHSQHLPNGRMTTRRNNLTKRLWIPAGFMIVCFFFFLFIATSKHRQEIIQPPVSVHFSRIWDSQFYQEAQRQSISYTQLPARPVRGGIIPHHLLAAPLIAGFFNGIAHQQVNTIILIGPNHYQAGPAAVSTTEAGWETPFGLLLPAQSLIHQLIHHSITQTDIPFDNEHAIYGITPFIKRTFPQAKIIPLIIKNGVSLSDCDAIIIQLKKIMTAQTLLIASVDFSHYLSSEEADRYDAQSIPALQTFAQDEIFHLDPKKNFDSPASLYILSSIMKKMNATPTLISTTNSAKLTHQPTLTSTTSYVTMYYTQQEK